MRFKVRNQLKLVFLVIVFIVFYNENLIYYFQSIKWPSLKCSKQENCVKILLVADPQILGEPSERQILAFLFNWDSDRYLSKTYARAVSYVNPDVILFLGDLMNDGSIATREEFYGYVKRLAKIFNTEYPIKHIWIPGDNDIGGENEPIRPEKVKMFNAAFKQPDYINVKFVDIYKSNYLMQLLPDPAHSHILPSNKTRIAISHMPLLLSPGRFTINVLTKIQPSAIFSGHRHTALHLETTLDSIFVSKVTGLTPKDENKIITIDLKREEYHEFVVPTSSYRMEVMNVGYSVAVIDRFNQKLHYGVLWSPQRFFQLKLYLITFMSVVLYIFLIILYKALSVTRACRNSYVYSKV